MIGGHSSCMAAIIHKGLAALTESVLGGDRIGTCFMANHTGTNANGGGNSSSQVDRVGNTVCCFSAR